MKYKFNLQEKEQIQKFATTTYDPSMVEKTNVEISYAINYLGMDFGEALEYARKQMVKQKNIAKIRTESDG